MVRVARVALLVGCVTLLSGCLKADYGYDLRADGSGSIVVEIRFGEELNSMLGSLGLGDLSSNDTSTLEDLRGQLPPEWADRVRVESIDDDRGAGVRLSIDFDDLTQLEDLRDIGDVGIPVITNEGERWRAELDVSSLTSAAGTLGGAADEFGAGGLGDSLAQMFGAIGGEPEFNVRMTMPGEILDADPSAEVDGDTATWQIVGDGSGTLYVESGTGAQGFLSSMIGGAPVWGLGLLGAVLLAAIVAVLVLLRRRPKGTAAPVATPPAPGAAPYAVPVAAGGVTADTHAWAPTAPPSGSGDLPPLGGWQAPAATSTTAALESPLAAGSSPEPTGELALATSDATVPFAPIGGVTAPVDAVPTAASSSPVAGWHPDPWGQATWRWWDGTDWSSHTA